jgi:hypothetical protein
MEREIIYGVCDKTGSCDSYFGFFKNQDDAQKEVQVQANRLKEDLGMMNITVLKGRAIIPEENKDKLVIVIHQFVLR